MDKLNHIQISIINDNSSYLMQQDYEITKMVKINGKMTLKTFKVKKGFLKKLIEKILMRIPIFKPRNPV